MSTWPYRCVQRTEPVVVNGRRCWVEMWTYAENDRRFAHDEETLADFNDMVEGFCCGNMRGYCSLAKYLEMFGGPNWEHRVEHAERHWFDAKSVAQEEKRIAELQGIVARRKSLVR